MAAESQVKAVLTFDISQFQQGVQYSLEDLKKLDAQHSLTAEGMKTKSQAMEESARAVADSTSELAVKSAEADKRIMAAKAEVAKAMRDVKNGAGDEKDALIILAHAQSELRAATAEGIEVQRRMTEAQRTMSEVAVEAKEALRGWGEAFLVFEAFDKLKEATARQLEYGEAIEQASIRTGLTAETLSVLHTYAEETGHDFDSLTKGIGMMAENMAKAREGNKEQAAFFEKLGLNVSDLSERNDGLSIAFERVLQKMAETTGKGNQTDLAFKAFGKSGKQNIDVLLALGENWGYWNQKTEASGRMLNGETAEALANTNKRFEDLKAKLEGVTTQFTIGLTPAVKQFIGILSGGKPAMESFQEAGRGISRVFAGIAAAAAGATYEISTKLALLSGGELTAFGRRNLADAQHQFEAMQKFADIAAGRTKLDVADAAASDAPKPEPPIGDDGYHGIGNTHGGDGANKAAEKRLKAMELDRTQEEEQGKLGAQADLDFWEKRVNAFKRGSEQYLAVQKKIADDKKALGQADLSYAAELARGAEITAHTTAAQAEANIALDLASGKISKLEADTRTAAVQAAEYAAKLAVLREQLAAINADKSISPEERRGKAEGVTNQIAEMQGQADAAALQNKARAATAASEAAARAAQEDAKFNAELTKGAEITADNARQTELAAIAEDEASGKIGKLAAAHRRAAIDTQLHTEKLLALWLQLKKLEEDAKTLKPGSEGAKQNSNQQLAVENQLKQEAGKRDAQGNQDQKAQATALAAPYQQAAKTIQSAFDSAFEAVLRGQKSIAQGAKMMANEMTMAVIHALEQQGEKWLAHEIMLVAQRHMANSQKVASDATAAGAGAAAASTANVASATSAAGVAGANAVAATAIIPFVGPELAPAAGAEAMSAALGFGSMAAFDVGAMEIPRTGIGILHKGETVLPGPSAEMLRERMSGPAGGGGSSVQMHLHGGTHFHGADAQDFGRQLDQHIGKAMKKALRGTPAGDQIKRGILK